MQKRASWDQERGKNHKVWQDGFHPVELSSNGMQEERLENIHNNPLVEGIVRKQ
ncbi:MAG: hypothetical protein ACFCUU_02950 [Cyclobacteriaceae bacterium]